MKRSLLKTTLVLSTVLVLAQHSFGDSKIRLGGGTNRNQGSSRSFTAKGSNSTQQGSGKQSGNLSGALSRFRQSGGGNAIGTYNANSSNSNGLLKRSEVVNTPKLKIALPPTLQNNVGRKIQLPNGTGKSPVAPNAAQFLKNKGTFQSLQAQQFQKIASAAPKHLCAQPHFNWWVNVCHNHNHTHYGCWNIHHHYWDSWTTCNWHVVQCQQFSYYVGMSCVHVPDMQACGVQTIVNGSPAHLAGMQIGDLILTVNGQPVADPNLVNAELVRGRLDLLVLREGAPAPLSLTIFPRLVQTVSF